MKNYEYPLDFSWTNEELMHVMAMWNALEAAYETGIAKDKFLTTYAAFKKVVPSKSQEKQLARAFEARSNYSLYKVWKLAQETTKKMIRMEVV